MAYKFNIFTGQFDLVADLILPPGLGDVVGPGSSVDGNIVVFDGTTGKVIEDSGVSVSDLTSFSNTFSSGDWVGPSGAAYSITVPFSTHGKSNPIIQVFEASGPDFIQVETGVKVDPSFNVILTVNSSPDLRFSGKFIIS